MKPLKLGTRGSELALWQARAVKSRLEALGHAVDVIVVKTGGDRLQEAPLSEIGGKGVFVKDLEDGLLRGDIDLAVHSAKDLPFRIPDGLTIAATLPREDPRDAIVLPAAAPLSQAGFAAIVGVLAEGRRTVGTGSVRRIAQLSPQVPGATFAAIRGNVDTRLKKLDRGEYDALVLACAGLRRLGLEARISAAIPVDRCVPAPGQGIVVIETRAHDSTVPAVVRIIHDEEAGVALAAERSLVEALGGDCQVPLGALARLNGGGLEMEAIVCSPDGRTAIRRRSRGPAGNPAVLGRRLADELVTAGASEILDQVRRPASGPGHTEGP
jgi:hydroxymethylbilane synthase